MTTHIPYTVSDDLFVCVASSYNYVKTHIYSICTCCRESALLVTNLIIHHRGHSPLKVDGLDYKTQRRAHRSDIFPHNTLYYCCLAGIVESAGCSASVNGHLSSRLEESSYSIKTLISLSFSRAFLRTDSIFLLLFLSSLTLEVVNGWL